MEEENKNKCPYGGTCDWDDGRVCERCPRYANFWYNDDRITDTMYGEKDCSTCKHYLHLVKVNMCLIYRCQTCPRENIFCARWERDNLDADNAEELGKQENAQTSN